MTNIGSEGSKNGGYLSYVNSDIKVEFPYRKSLDGVHIQKGEEIGKFNMGSTVVLIFEGSSVDFNCKSR